MNFLILLLVWFFSFSSGRIITITNNCGFDIWPGIFTSNNTGPGTGGFFLPSRTSLTLSVANDWSGRIWARTNCTFNQANVGSCATGSCGNALNCSVTGTPPTTLAEFTLQGDGNQDFFDLSQVNGYNVPMAIFPNSTTAVTNKSPICQWPDNSGLPENSQGLQTSISDQCPVALLFQYKDNPAAGCMSACDRFLSPGFCCTSPNNTAETCSPTPYSKIFKALCPNAYSFAFDDPSSTFTLPSEFTVSYEVAFCPGITLYDFERWLIVVHGSTNIKNGSVRLSMVRGIWLLEALLIIFVWFG
jgi:Thaumatin family